MVSHAPGQLLPTIRSRTRRLDLKPLPEDAILMALRNSPTEADADPADLALTAALAQGSLRRAIAFSEGEGLALYRAFGAFAARLPDVDVAAMHAFADRVSGYRNDETWNAFRDVIAGWLHRRIRGEAEPHPTAL